MVVMVRELGEMSSCHGDFLENMGGYGILVAVSKRLLDVSSIRIVIIRRGDF
jgi:hypothetical protein